MYNGLGEGAPTDQHVERARGVGDEQAVQADRCALDGADGRTGDAEGEGDGDVHCMRFRSSSPFQSSRDERLTEAGGLVRPP
jgi:hypothetical protein